jgi:hypothetical protein
MLGLRHVALACVLLGAALPVAGAPEAGTTFSSGPRRVVLIELFTSEGCSSCPPADRWLSGLKTDPALWRNFVPIAFHVDYWDDIGWRDRFAQAAFSDRQRRYARAGAARTVYTPGVFRQGREWRGWDRAPAAVVDRPRVGDLSLSMTAAGVAVRFEDESGVGRSWTVHLAVLGMNLETPVSAGENAGRMLRHDFVALEVVSVPLARERGGYTAMVAWPERVSRGSGLALAAWVSEVGQQVPIQSVGGFLPTPCCD